MPYTTDPRANSNRRGYNSAWRRIRKAYLMVNPSCIACGHMATVVDHIRPHMGSRSLFWDVGNWQPMCARCHSRKTVLYDNGFGNKSRARVA